MANNKKLVEAITSMEDDFAQWYTDVVKKAELCGYTSVKGCTLVKNVRPARRTFMNVRQHCRDLWVMCIMEWVEEDRLLFSRMKK